jgi:hypothetical protein
VPEATVKVHDRFSDPVAELVTDDNGDVVFTSIVVSRGKNSLSKITPHWLSVSKDAYADNVQRVSVEPNQSTTVTLVHE